MGEEQRTILLVDDDEQILELLVRDLEGEGHRCIACATGGDALARFAEDGADLALVDLMLPDFDGVELARRLKEEVEDGGFLPVVLITAAEGVEERVRGFSAGCDDFLGKPINLFELNARVKSLLMRRAQHVELAEANAKLRDLHERKQVLASLVVHDLRNPLSALQGNIDLLLEEVANYSEFAKEILDDCRLLTSKALSMVAGLLDVEELEEGLLHAAPTEVDITDWAQGAATHHWATVRARKLSLQFDVEKGLRARLDPDLLGRVLENLLDNAVRYAPRKGLVAVSASMEDSSLVLRVGNDGPPVPESERSLIFGRYYRIEARRSGARANRGLGLYFCKLAVEAHGGTIAIEELEDLPASFVVRIPQARKSAG